jgi:uncharacterized damage-inducible protein DinB
MNADDIRLLYAYNAWANALILDKTAGVSEADYFATRPGLSFGSLHGTLLHTLGAEALWYQRWQGESPPAMLSETDLPTFAALRERWRAEEAKQQAYLAKLRDLDIEAPLNYRTTEGNTYTQPLGPLMVHLVNHGTQFRAEAAVALTQIGRSPGDLDFVLFLRQQPA